MTEQQLLDWIGWKPYGDSSDHYNRIFALTCARWKRYKAGNLTQEEEEDWDHDVKESEENHDY